MEEEENKQEMTTFKQGHEAEVALGAMQQPGEKNYKQLKLRREKAAAYQRARVARLRALGLSARGNPLKDRHRKKRDIAKQRQYQHNFAARHKAAREALGLTISQFNKLPRAQRMIAYNKLKHPKEWGDKAERNRAAKREWYRQNKDKVMAARRAKALPTVKEMNAEWAAASDNRAVRFCPHCGWNIDATRKAQAFVDGRAS
jgi:hypothetical protein